MIARIFDLGANRVILTEPSPLFGFPAIVQKRLSDYGSVIDTLCAITANVECGPDLLSLLTADDFERSEIHPNAAGHRKIAEALADTITSVPEPSTALLLGMGLMGSAYRYRRTVSEPPNVLW